MSIHVVVPFSSEGRVVGMGTDTSGTVMKISQLLFGGCRIGQTDAAAYDYRTTGCANLSE